MTLVADSRSGTFSLRLGGVLGPNPDFRPCRLVVDADASWRIEPDPSPRTGAEPYTDCMAGPALADMHVHLYNAEQLPVFMAHGVTAVRDLGCARQLQTALLSAGCDRPHPVPKLMFGGPVLDRPGPQRLATAVPWQHPRDLPRIVAATAEAGSTWLKIYAGFPETQLKDAVRLAHEARLKVAYHPAPGAAVAAIDAGVDELEHVAALAWNVGEVDSSPRRRGLHAANERWSSVHVTDSDIVRLTAVQLCPTVGVQAALLQGAREGWNASTTPRDLLAHWNSLTLLKPWTAVQLTAASSALTRMCDFVERFRQHGGRIVMGSDTPNPGLLAGSSLWQEIDLIGREAGLPMKSYLLASHSTDGVARSGAFDLMLLTKARVRRALDGCGWDTGPVRAVLCSGQLWEFDGGVREATT